MRALTQITAQYCSDIQKTTNLSLKWYVTDDLERQPKDLAKHVPTETYSFERITSCAKNCLQLNQVHGQ